MLALFTFITGITYGASGRAHRAHGLVLTQVVAIVALTTDDHGRGPPALMTRLLHDLIIGTMSAPYDVIEAKLAARVLS